ncbi:MAG TPA: ABC transporter permease [Thermoanaerobaculia bacterium]
MSVPSDLRYGFRQLNNDVGFTAVAVVCLALGICASITVFAVVDSLLIRDFPGVVEQGRILSVATRTDEEGRRNGISHRQFLRYKEATRIFSDLATYQPLALNLSGAGEPLKVDGHLVSENYFHTLGLRGAAGRFFELERPRQDREAVILSHQLWQRLYGGRPAALGSVLNLNGHAFTVIGIAPEGFRGVVLNQPADLWLPAEAARWVLPYMGGTSTFEDSQWLFFFFGRLAPGKDVGEARRELDLLASRFAKESPEDGDSPGLAVYEGLGVWPGTRHRVAGPLSRLAGLVGLLMLVVCANLGGLLLARASSRREEIGVRLALGVTRGRLIRQLLAESIALSLLGGTVGFLLSLFVMDAIRGWALGQYLPKLENLTVDVRVVAFTLFVSLAAGILFGLAPAFWATRRQVMSLLHQSVGGSGPDRSRTSFQEALVVGQVTLSLMLLVSTGLLVRTFLNLRAVDPGFDSHDVLQLKFDLSLRGYSEAAGAEFLDRLLGQVRRVPQVRNAALSVWAPLSSASLGLTASLRPLSAPVDRSLQVSHNLISPGFFQTLGIPLVRGRDFSPEDRKGALQVLIVDESLAAKFWPGRNPIGEQVAWGSGKAQKVWQVVGVARRVYTTDLASRPQPFFYIPLAQKHVPVLSLQVKTVGDPMRALDSIRAVFRKLDPNLAVDVNLLEEETAQTFSQPRLFSVMLGGFSLTSLLVTAIGLYGTLSYTVSRRTRELGIRMALGARNSEVMGMVLRRGLALTLLGLALGTLTAVWTTTALSGLLFGVSPTDPMVFATVAVILILVGFLASSLPAWRATRVDPMAIIRHE